METMQNDLEYVELRAALQNDVTYSHATSAIWQLAVYDTLHGGRRYANIGGRQLLEHLGSAALQDVSAVSVRRWRRSPGRGFRWGRTSRPDRPGTCATG